MSSQTYWNRMLADFSRIRSKPVYFCVNEWNKIMVYISAHNIYVMTSFLLDVDWSMFIDWNKFNKTKINGCSRFVFSFDFFILNLVRSVYCRNVVVVDKLLNHEPDVSIADWATMNYHHWPLGLIFCIAMMDANCLRLHWKNDRFRRLAVVKVE